MPITKHEAARLRGYISHYVQTIKAREPGRSIGLTTEELHAREDSAHSNLYRFILELIKRSTT